MTTNLLLTLVGLFMASKIFIAIWIYKDAKSKEINPWLWTILVFFFSGPLIFLIYFLVIRKEKNIKCENCSYIQSEKLLYCGRCGNEIKIDKYEESFNKESNKIFLNIGIILLIIGIVLGSILVVQTVLEDKDGLPDRKSTRLNSSHRPQYLVCRLLLEKKFF